MPFWSCLWPFWSWSPLPCWRWTFCTRSSFPGISPTIFIERYHEKSKAYLRLTGSSKSLGDVVRISPILVGLFPTSDDGNTWRNNSTRLKLPLKGTSSRMPTLHGVVLSATKELNRLGIFFCQANQFVSWIVHNFIRLFFDLILQVFWKIVFITPKHKKLEPIPVARSFLLQTFGHGYVWVSWV